MVFNTFQNIIIGSVEALQSQLTSSINEKAEYDNKGRVKSM